MNPTRMTQPYRRGARAPGPALDAMLAGRASTAPGAALVAATNSVSPATARVQLSPLLRARKGRKILVPQKVPAILKHASRL